MKIKHFTILLLSLISINTASAQLQIQKLEFDLDKDGITDSILFNNEKGRLEIQLSSQAPEVIYTDFLFDPLKIYTYLLKQQEETFSLQTYISPYINTVYFYYDEYEKRIRLKNLTIDSRKNPPGHGYKVISYIDLLSGEYSEHRTIYKAATDEFIEDVYTGKKDFQAIFIEDFIMNTFIDILKSLTYDEEKSN